jgi:hypothetical protein
MANGTRASSSRAASASVAARTFGGSPSKAGAGDADGANADSEGAGARAGAWAGDAAKARVFGLIAAAHQDVPGVARGFAHAGAVDDGKFLVQHIVEHPLARLAGA